jgi:hypothetical protein
MKERACRSRRSWKVQASVLEVKAFAYRRVKNVRDVANLADLLRMGRLPRAPGACARVHHA